MAAEQLKIAFDLFYPFSLSFWKEIDELGETITVDREQTIKHNQYIQSFLLTAENFYRLILEH
jgi:hypothetical protein